MLLRVIALLLIAIVASYGLYRALVPQWDPSWASEAVKRFAREAPMKFYHDAAVREVQACAWTEIDEQVESLPPGGSAEGEGMKVLIISPRNGDRNRVLWELYHMKKATNGQSDGIVTTVTLASQDGSAMVIMPPSNPVVWASDQDRIKRPLAVAMKMLLEHRIFHFQCFHENLVDTVNAVRPDRFDMAVELRLLPDDMKQLLREIGRVDENDDEDVLLLGALQAMYYLHGLNVVRRLGMRLIHSWEQFADVQTNARFSTATSAYSKLVVLAESLRVQLTPKTPSHRAILGISDEQWAAAEDKRQLIIQAYRAKAREAHPDRRGGSAEQMAELTKAKNALLEQIA